MSKTIQEKLEAARKLVAKYEQKIKSDAIINNVEEGDVVTIKFGRGDKVRNITGKIVGTNPTDTGLTVVVLGEDFKPYTVFARDILSNDAAEARNAAAAGDDAAEAVEGDDLAAIAAEAAGEDPLTAA